MKNSIFLAIAYCFMSINLFSQELELRNWKGYSSLLQVNDITEDSDGNIWACANGGAFKYNLDTKSITSYNNVDALLSIDIETLNYNQITNEVYFGSADGFIDIIDSEGDWTHITDIATSGFSNKLINDIDFHDSRAFFTGGFGLAVFDINQKIFIENVPRFGRFNNSVVVNQCNIYDNTIFLATTQGLAVADISSLLADPGNWQTFSEEENNLSIDEIEIVNGTIYLRSNTMIYEAIIENENLTLVEIKDVVDIEDIATDGNKLFISQYGFLIDLENVLLFQAESTIKTIHISENNFVLGLNENGLITLENFEKADSIIPNSPASNGFHDLDIDSEGNLWIASDRYGEGVGKGIMKFDGEIWQNFTFPQYTALINNSYYWLSVMNDGRIAASNYGLGLAIIDTEKEDLDFMLFNETNSPLTGYQGESFVVSGENRVDQNGTVWCVNFAVSGSGPVLVAYTEEGNLYSFRNEIEPSIRRFNPLTIDLSGTKWVGGFRGSGRGVMYFNERNTLEDQTDDIYGFFSTSTISGLTSNDNLSLETDKLGLVWIGSLEGLSVVINPSAVFSNSELVLRQIDIVSNEKINDIMIDALNNKWLATEKGVWVLNEDATELLGIIDKDNSPLPTNSVLSLATNENTGEIYFGTSKGLYSATSFNIRPIEAFDLKCYPQPYEPLNNEFMVIEGLVPGSEIRILNKSGELIRKLVSQSRITTWDGRNQYGEFVETGVYLVVTSSSVNEASAVQKIAVIRE